MALYRLCYGYGDKPPTILWVIFSFQLIDKVETKLSWFLFVNNCYFLIKLDSWYLTPAASGKKPQVRNFLDVLSIVKIWFIF